MCGCSGQRWSPKPIATQPPWRCWSGERKILVFGLTKADVTGPGGMDVGQPTLGLDDDQSSWEVDGTPLCIEPSGVEKLPQRLRHHKDRGDCFELEICLELGQRVSLPGGEVNVGVCFRPMSIA
jgi:hypothetical protein